MQKSDLVSNHQVTALGAERAATVVPALLAAFLGVAILWGVGFAAPSVIHNIAHDTRHSQAFPCH